MTRSSPDDNGDVTTSVFPCINGTGVKAFSFLSDVSVLSVFDVSSFLFVFNVGPPKPGVPINHYRLSGTTRILFIFTSPL